MLLAKVFEDMVSFLLSEIVIVVYGANCVPYLLIPRFGPELNVIYCYLNIRPFV